MRIELVLPIGPSVNHIYERRRGGYELRLTDAARAYRLIVGRAVADLKLPVGAKAKPPIRLGIHLTLPSWRRQDLDNAAKVLQDALAEALGFDDNRVVDLHMTKEIVKGCDPVCIVTLLDADEAELHARIKEATG